MSLEEVKKMNKEARYKSTTELKLKSSANIWEEKPRKKIKRHQNKRKQEDKTLLTQSVFSINSLDSKQNQKSRKATVESDYAFKLKLDRNGIFLFHRYL